MSLQGVLSDFGLADVFQLISQQRKSGVLEVTHSARTLEVRFFEGSVSSATPSAERPDSALGTFLVESGCLSDPDLAAALSRQDETLTPLRQVLDDSGQVLQAEFDEIGALLTKETLFELFGWANGSFRFWPQSRPSRPESELLGTEGVLLDTLRMRDEWPGLSRQLPDASMRVVPAAGIEEFEAGRAALESETRISADRLTRLFVAAEGRLPARRVIALSQLGTFDGTKVLAAMVGAGLLRLDPPESRSMDEAPRPARSRSVLTLGVLGIAAAVVILMSQFPEIRSEYHPIPSDELREARSRVAEEQIWLQLEAYRWRTGQYPEVLGQLGMGARGRLAGSEHDRYSYSRSPAGYRLSRRLP